MKRTLLIATTVALFPLVSFAEEPMAGTATPTSTTSTMPSTTTTTPTTTTGTPTTPTETKSSTDMTKDAWLGQMSPLLPDVVCKGFLNDEGLKKRFDELKIGYEKCVTLIPDISTKCQQQIYADVPATINNDNASKWGRTLGECIGKNFAEQYLVPKS